MKMKYCILLDSCFHTIRRSSSLVLIAFIIVSNVYMTRAQCPPDTILPVAVCHSELAISLNNLGMALVPAFYFDNGSYDNCGPIWFKVKRMTRPVGYDCVSADNPNYMFHDSLKLCCGDVGDTIVAILRVYEQDPGPGPVSDDTLSGHFNDCMVNVMAIDKIAPVITCPPDTTIDCGFIYSDLSTLGMPDIDENCDSIRIEIKIDSQLNMCGTGMLLRKFIVTDGSGLQDSCVQIITVENNHPFDGNDPMQLIWPPDTTVFDCMAVVDTAISGYPIIIEDECDLVGVSYEDEVYNFAKNGACYKVIRKWIVIDWCQHVPGIRNPYTADNGYWTHEQFIKVMDTLAPIVTGPVDTAVLNFSPDCGPRFVNLPVAESDDCGNIDPIVFSIEIDFQNNGTIDTVFDGNDASGLYPNGTHKINFLAKDRCGNIGVLSILLTVTDGKLPTPISRNGIIVVLTQMANNNIMATLTAHQLNVRSFDNCTPEDSLLFSFSRDVNDTLRVFDCDSVGIRSLEFWVTDLEGNQDFAITFVNVEDTDTLCPSNITTTVVTGNISTSGNSGVEYVDMHLNNAGTDMITSTNKNGDYEFKDVIMGNTYQLTPIKRDQPGLGITTKDLLIIKKHLLGIKKIESTNGLIAADVDKSNSISTRDIVLLRKMILNKIDAFPHEMSWRFVLSGYKFSDPGQPLSTRFPESYMMHNIRDIMKVSFEAIKIGDVDNSSELNNIQSRNELSELPISWVESKSGSNQSDWLLMINEDIDMEGLELELSLPDNIVSVQIESLNLPGFSDKNYAFHKKNNKLLISWTEIDGVSLFKGQYLFKLKSNLVTPMPFGLNLNMNSLNGLAYMSDGSDHVLINEALLEDKGTFSNGIELYQNAPNPFSNATNIQFYLPFAGDVKLVIRDAIGKKFYSDQRAFVPGSHQWTIDEFAHWPDGIYFYSIMVNGQQLTKRMIHMTE